MLHISFNQIKLSLLISKTFCKNQMIDNCLIYRSKLSGMYFNCLFSIYVAFHDNDMTSYTYILTIRVTLHVAASIGDWFVWKSTVKVRNMFDTSMCSAALFPALHYIFWMDSTNTNYLSSSYRDCNDHYLLSVKHWLFKCNSHNHTCDKICKYTYT